MRKHPEIAVRVAALWAMHGAGLLEDGHVLLEDVMSSNLPPVLAATARIDGERSLLMMHTFKRLDQLASHPDPSVRLATLVAVRQLTSGDLVVDTPPTVPLSEVAPGGILSSLYFSTARHPDPDIEHLYWHAVEPLIAYDPAHAIGFYEEDGGRKPGFASELLRSSRSRAGPVESSDSYCENGRSVAASSLGDASAQCPSVKRGGNVLVALPGPFSRRRGRRHPVPALE